MKRKIITAIALALCLSGCGDTVVFLPEEPAQILAVPVDNTEVLPEGPVETETQVPTPAIPEETETNKIQYGGKAPSSANKGNSEIGSTVGSTTVIIPTATEPKETEPAATQTKPKETKPAPTESVQLRPTQPVDTKPKETEPEATESVVLRPTGSAETVPLETKPPETAPPATESPATKPPVTEPPETKPPVTVPPETKPPVTEPPATKPPVTEPNETKPPATEPSETKPPVTEPPATKPPQTEPPATEPPATKPPATEPPITEPPLYDISGYVVGDLEYEILDRVNEYRTEEGLGELYLDTYLCAIASCRGYEASLVWSHTRPDGRRFVTVLDDYGYGAGSAQELLAYATADAGAMVDKWMSSDSHRSILLGSYSTLGVGVYRVGGYTFVACLLVE